MTYEDYTALQGQSEPGGAPQPFYPRPHRRKRKVTKEDVLKVRAIKEKYPTITCRDLSDMIGRTLSDTTVSRILSGQYDDLLEPPNPSHQQFSVRPAEASSGQPRVNFDLEDIRGTVQDVVSDKNFKMMGLVDALRDNMRDDLDRIYEEQVKTNELLSKIHVTLSTISEYVMYGSKDEEDADDAAE